MPERPNLGARRAPRPAPDAHIDPVEPVKEVRAQTEVTREPVSQPHPTPKSVERLPFSNRLSSVTIDTLARVKVEEKIAIYEAIEYAVAQVWGKYERKQ